MKILVGLILILALILIFSLLLLMPSVVLGLEDAVREWILERLHGNKGEQKDVKRKDGRRC